MTLCLVCFVLVLVLTTHAWRTEYTEKGTEEGDECHREGKEVWRCSKGKDCAGLKDTLRLNGRLKTCSWKGQTPILCCPPKKEPERIQVSKSEERCADYKNLLCGNQNNFLLESQAQVPSSLQRKKRQVLNKPDVETLPPPGIAGGEPTKSGEYPSMTLQSLLRKKRQGDNQPESTTYPVFAIIGGRLTKAQEFPSMVEDKEPVFHIQVAGGEISRPMENPHMALIGYGDSGTISWQCGGSLISENFVLSAAHCVNTPYGLARWVRLGDLDIKLDNEEARPQELEIVERVVHPGYRAPAFYNDLALFRLSRPVVFDQFVRPACLHMDRSDPPGVGTAAGWGKNETNGPRSSALQQVDISFVPAEDCKRIVGVLDKYLPDGVDTDTMVCAGELGKDTCQGDSGGPLILPATPWSNNDCLARLVGVTSFGPRNCGMTQVPGAYVRVAFFISWIESVVWPQ